MTLKSMLLLDSLLSFSGVDTLFVILSKSKRTNDELQLDNEDALLLRFYYKHDEPDINKADTEGRVSEVVSKVNFRKAPRLWSNHLGITRAKIQKIEEDCYYTLPGHANDCLLLSSDIRELTFPLCSVMP